MINPLGFVRDLLEAGGRYVSYQAMQACVSAYLFFCPFPTSVSVTITTDPEDEEEDEDTPALGDPTYVEWLEQLYNESPSGPGGDGTRLG